MRYVVMVMALACLDLSTAQATTPEERESLRGLTGVSVVIEEINPDAQADGLSEEDVRTDVEFILRSSGIRVLTVSEIIKTPAQPYLYVRVHTIEDEGNYAFSVEVALKQQVSLFHRPQHKMSAATWNIHMTGTAVKYKIRGSVSNTIEPLVMEFANDFLTMHP